ncbi:hypothetical protein NDU88_007958 [Pleurodeles waltl]|uniref:Uncharacterized protein n=1 Tax=Pleurodeles waltl TaxID=8319 RepID=A0AAV7NBP9_PLEWA|nr:hypothetical protein NDU88_007958 [Pleurodeles waltl]
MDKFPGGTPRKKTPDVFPRGTVGRTFYQYDVYIWDHDLQRLTELGTRGEKERNCRGDEHQAAMRGEILAAASGEDAGPVAERPGMRGEEKRCGEHQEPDAGAGRSEGIYTMGQPRHVPGGTWQYKVRRYFKEGRAFHKKGEGKKWETKKGN